VSLLIIWIACPALVFHSVTMDEPLIALKRQLLNKILDCIAHILATENPWRIDNINTVQVVECNVLYNRLYLCSVIPVIYNSLISTEYIDICKFYIIGKRMLWKKCGTCCSHDTVADAMIPITAAICKSIVADIPKAICNGYISSTDCNTSVRILLSDT